MDKQHEKREGLEERPEVKIHSEQYKKKKKQIGQLQAMMAYMDSGSKNSLPSMTDYLLK